MYVERHIHGVPGASVGTRGISNAALPCYGRPAFSSYSACYQGVAAIELFGISCDSPAQPLRIRSATLTTDEIYHAFLGTYADFKTFFHGHSYTGNPLGCAVALANIEVFQKEKTLARLQPKIKTMVRLLQPLRQLAPLPRVQ